MVEEEEAAVVAARVFCQATLCAVGQTGWYFVAMALPAAVVQLLQLLGWFWGRAWAL